jgi:UDP-N-acetylmuramate--alanine ligase
VTEPRPIPPTGDLYFVGIGGAGQSALAWALAQQGHRVRGADPGIAPAVRARLEEAGATVFTTHEGANVGAAALVIATDAVDEANPEVAWAHAQGIPVMRRPEALGAVVQAAKTAICVAGTHGKTTTTGMIASILIEAGLDPTVLVGGDFAFLPGGGNARAGDPDLVVVEACEAYGGLDWLRPTIAVITNIEADHLDHHGTEAALVDAFARFVAQIRSEGIAVACADDPIAVRVSRAAPAARVYGDGCDRSAIQRLGLRVPGVHNATNAAGAAAACRALGVADSAIQAGLIGFTGAGRRFEVLGDTDGGVAVIDDYAHHPTELRAALAAARAAYPGRRLVAVFQPHLPSRTRDFLEGFAAALADDADAVFLTEIYLAREPEQPGLARSLADATARRAGTKPVRFVADRHELPAEIRGFCAPGDIVLMMGAGNIRSVGEELVQR